MSYFKKILSIFILFSFIVTGSLLFSSPTSAMSTTDISSEQLLESEKNDLLKILLNNGLILPDDYKNHKDLAENFVKKYTALIISGKVNPDMKIFNYDQSNDLLQSLGETLESMGFNTSNFIRPLASYTLKNSTVLNSWQDSFHNYNCYGYALGKLSSFVDPGDFSNNSFSMTLTISGMADLVLEDLDTLGYDAYKTTTKPTSLPDQYCRLICIRKDNSNDDYHFMKIHGTSLNTWHHKPSYTQPLKWNYSSPNYTTWTNEAVYYDTTYEPTITYESTIYYIVYKSRNSPGEQLTNLSNNQLK